MKKTKRRKHFERTEYKLNGNEILKIIIGYFFVILSILFIIPPKPNSIVGDNQYIEYEQMIFKFHGSAHEWGIDEIKDVHGASERWKYLFDDSTTSNQIFTGTINTSSGLIENISGGVEDESGTDDQKKDFSNISGLPKASIVDIHTPSKYAKIISHITLPNYYVAVETIVFSRDLAVYYLENFLEGDRSKLAKNTDGVVYKDCVGLDGETIHHGDFIIAYQQRSDVTNICNVEKRYCNDGILEGSYTGTYCDEKAKYTYEKDIPISVNQFVPNEYIQPRPPKNALANFSSQGKINETLQPTTWWEEQPSRAVIVNSSGINQTVITYKNCRTPRNEKVLNGHFVRAYKNSQGYTNIPCQVEIRMCINGKLKGTFKYKSCTYTGVSYEMAHGIK